MRRVDQLRHAEPNYDGARGAAAPDPPSPAAACPTVVDRAIHGRWDRMSVFVVAELRAHLLLQDHPTGP